MLLGVDSRDLLILTLSLGLAVGGEVVNTAIEVLCDKLHPAHDPEIGKVKDLGAGLVIISGIPAVLATILILGLA
jgi:diacylglycerol kinase